MPNPVPGSDPSSRGAPPATATASAPASGRLARAAYATRWRELAEPVRRQAADLFLDTLAVMAAGSVHASVQPWIRASVHGPGACTVMGLAATGEAEGFAAAASTTAGLLNGGATTVLQWQDGHRRARGHPASHLVPALLALAEERDATSDEVMSAFVAGYEVGTRVGVALGGLQTLLHDGGTWATLGAAAACAKLLGAGAGGIDQAIEGAATVAPMAYRDTVSQGATVHHLYIGLGAATAIITARAAMAGLDAIPGTLEAFFGPRAGAHFRAEALCQGIDTEDRWSRYELLDAYFKWHPVCAHFSGLADALEQVVRDFARQHGRRPSHADLDRIDIALYGTALSYDTPAPRSELAARFSARAIAFASFDHGGLTGDALARTAAPAPAVRDWLARVQVAHDPALDAGYPAGRPARVTLHLVDGATLTAEVNDVYGDAMRPMTAADRAAKAQAALARRYGAAGAQAVRQAFARFLAGEPLAVLSVALRAPASPA